MELCQILAERERRWNARLSMAGSYNCPVLSLTLNIPGPDKNLPGAEAALNQLRAALRERVEGAGGVLLEECRLSGPDGTGANGLGADGPAWIAAVRMDAIALKELAVAVEEQHMLGRLADADVMDAQGRPVNREHLDAAPSGPGGSQENAELPARGACKARAPRQCFLCSRPASLCRREGRHSLEELLAAVRGMLRLASETAGRERVCRP